MLREICKRVSYDDDFVGLHFIDNKPEVVFPRGYSISIDDDDVRRDKQSGNSCYEAVTNTPG